MRQRSKIYYEFGNFRLDVDQQSVSSDESVVVLKPKIFELLLLLVQNSKKILTKELLMREIWQGYFVETHNLTVNICELRQILGESRSRHSYIETIPKRGYRFISEVRRFSTESEDLITKEPSKEDIDTGKKKVHSVSITVLPFKTNESKFNDEHLSIGISNALITKLGNLGVVIICPLDVVRKYAERSYNLQAIGKKLKADWVLDGTVRKINKLVRISVRLVRVRDGRLLWAEKFDDKFINVLDVEDSISEQVVDALLSNLGVNEKSIFADRYTNDIEAYRLYLKGRYCLEKRTVVEFKKANKYFKQAVELDSNYAPAYAGLADSYNLLCSYGFFSLDESVEKIKTAALKAIEIAPELAEPHAALGHLKIFRLWEFSEGEEELKSAIKLNPNYTNALLWYGLYLRMLGRFEESIEKLRRAQETDPLSFNVNNAIGAHYYFTRQYDAGISHLQELIKFDASHSGTHFYLGQCYERKNMHKEAIMHFQKAIDYSDSSNPEVHGYLGYTYAKAGQKAKAMEILDRLKNPVNHQAMQSSLVGLIYTGLGELGNAFKWMNKAYQERSVSLTMIHFEPKMDELYSDPRYSDLSQKLVESLATKN